MNTENAIRTPKKTIEKILKTKCVETQWLAGDGSDRSYYRIKLGEQQNQSTDQSTLVLMQLNGSDRISLQGNKYEWEEMARTLASKEFLVPKVIDVFRQEGELLIQDFGDQTLEALFSRIRMSGKLDQENRLYGKCFDIISKFLKLDPSCSELWTTRSFDCDKLMYELIFFTEHFPFKENKKYLQSGWLELVKRDFRAISEFLAERSKYFVHRDFHSRNLIAYLNEIAVIDFQDARLGPASYDVVSLVFDSYLPLDNSRRLELLSEATNHLADTCDETVREDMNTTWKPMLIQRQLKALGSFGYLENKCKRGPYLKYAPAAIETLNIDLYDERWPFLSGEFLNYLNSTHNI